MQDGAARLARASGRPGAAARCSAGPFFWRFSWASRSLVLAWRHPVMGLSYHFSLSAPVTASPGELASFLRGVEAEARRLGFAPTLVVEGPFDTPERRQFARRVARGLTVEDARLRGVELAEGLCWSSVPAEGLCRLVPEHGVLLVATDARGIEAVFGFFRFPVAVTDRRGRVVMPLPLGWSGRDSLGSPDPRYRAIVALFREAGYLESELDEFAPAPAR